MSEAITVAMITAGGVALAALGGLLGAIASKWFDRRKDGAEADSKKAEATQTITETVMSLIEPLRQRIDELENDLRQVKWENSNLRKWAERLVAQVKQLGGDPCEYEEDLIEGKKPND